MPEDVDRPAAIGIDHLAAKAGRQQLVVAKTSVPDVLVAVGTTADNGLQVEKIDLTAESLTAQARRPARASGSRTVADLDSFLAELKRRPLPADSGTLWGCAQSGTITAIYNDHGDSEDDDSAGHRDDSLTMVLKKDDDWKAWHELSGKLFSQEDFGDKIEELLHTITRPDQADLMEVIDSVRSSSSGEFESRISRADGAQRLTYNVEHQTTAGRTRELEVPQTISMDLRPWDGHVETYPVDAWFRLRIVQGKLTLGVKLKPTRQLLRTAWLDVTDKVKDAAGRPVYSAESAWG